MSLILDALRRSEAERESGESPPGIASQSWPASEPATPASRRWLPWLLAGVASAAVLGLLFKLALETRPAGPAVVAEVSSVGAGTGAGAGAAAVAAAPAADIADAPQAREPGAAGQGAAAPPASPGTDANRTVPARSSVPVATTATQSATGAEVAALYQSAAGEGASAGRASPGRASPGRASPDRSDGQDSAALAVQAVPVAEAVTVEPTAPEVDQSLAEPESAVRDLDIDQLVSAARTEMAQARLSEHTAPFISELSQTQKDAIPTLYYNQHDYGAPAGASVMLNGEVLVVGQSLSGGFEVMEILPDSVVLEHRGTQFRLRALNSWVNL